MTEKEIIRHDIRCLRIATKIMCFNGRKEYVFKMLGYLKNPLAWKKVCDTIELRYNDGSHYTKDEHGHFTGSTSSGGSSGKVNYAKPLDMLNYSNIPESEMIKAENIIDDLKKTDIGRETLRVLEMLPEPVKFTYGEYYTGVRGEERNGRITIYLNNCKNTLWASRSVIHECTHYRYGIGQSQWAECVCVAQELKHARGRNKSTYGELRMIVRAVKDVYPEYNWRKGGIINGKRKSR